MAAEAAYLLLLVALMYPTPSRAAMKWQSLLNKDAVCNDFSRAGYFIETTNASNKWIIFLESGGLCFSPASCNIRFFHPDIRTEFATNQDEPFYEFNPIFNLSTTWKMIENRNLSEVINPYMTSIDTYIKDNGQLEIEGRDILDGDPETNEIFYNYNRIVVPYCSSDMWLGSDSATQNINLDSNDTQRQFLRNVYEPESERLQFTFRGQIIIQSLIDELLENKGLANATELVLSGSSAGGLGAVNSAKSILEKLPNTVKLSIIADSSWFINFRRDIERRFDGLINESPVSTDSDGSGSVMNRGERLFELISSIPQCSTISNTGSPCCISFDCILQDDRFFPVGEVPILVLFSLYDIFLLADAISRQIPTGELGEANQPDIGLDFLFTVAEYGGAMNSSLAYTVPQVPMLSFIVTRCFQHVYLATSTLWGTDENGIFGDSSNEQLGISQGSFTGSFTHTIRSNVWSSYYFSGRESQEDNVNVTSCDPSDAFTIQDAINMWYRCRYTTDSLSFRDTCYSVHCNEMCPDRVDFERSNAERYPDWSVIIIIVLVVVVTVVSIVTKIIFYVWEAVLTIRQNLYLQRLAEEEEQRIAEEEEEVDVVPDFPMCGLDEAVSVACIDLAYSVQFKQNKVKDEKRDTTSVSFALDDTIHNQSDDEDDDDFNLERSRSIRNSYKTRKDWASSVMRKASKMSLPNVSLPKSGPRDIGLEENDIGHKRLRRSSSPEAWIPEGKVTLTSLPVIRKDSSSPEGLVSHNNENENENRREHFTRQNAQDSKNYLPKLSLVEEEERRTSNARLLSSGSEDLNEIHKISENKHIMCNPCKKERKQILKGISVYFNPGELVGIMGPSGCGKTTLLNLLTGRRSTGSITGEIFVNGVHLDTIREEYISYTGYVLQLATPYYEELTVRENITLAAHMKLSRKMTWREKFERVEQVIEVTGLLTVQDTIVGGLSGSGLSGGQKKRLVIALQLLTMPKVIFLDEPTSGLDATSSVELLSHLNRLADSNRTVVLTIHQPRFEIFYMFHKLILLSDGKIAYHGVPRKAYGVFVEALMSNFLGQGLLIPKIEEHNPADIIMDMLGKPKLREMILDYYQESAEPDLIKWAIKRARVKDFECMSIETIDREDGKIPYYRMDTDKGKVEKKSQKRDMARMFDRLAVLETRAGKRSNFIWRAYLPLTFFAYGVLLGTVYFQQDEPLLIMSGFCVYSVASALFMFPVMQNYYLKALEVYGFERGDGAGRATDIIIQGFTRFITMAVVPVVLCALVLYLLLVRMEFWSVSVFLQLVVVAMALNQAWVGILTFLLCAVPDLAFRLSPIISSVAGFTSGFFIPRDSTPWVYRWLFFINPNYYGFSASANILLRDFGEDCRDSNVIECYLNSGDYILNRFNFNDIKIYQNVAILLLMTLIYLILASLSNWLRHTSFFITLKTKFRKKSTFVDEDDDSLQFVEEGIEIEGEENEDKKSKETLVDLQQTTPPPEDDTFESTSNASTPVEKRKVTIVEQPSVKYKKKWKEITVRTLENEQQRDEFELEQIPTEGENDVKFRRPERLNLRERKKRRGVKSLFLSEGEQHMVYKPGNDQTPGTRFVNVIDAALAQKAATPTPTSHTGSSLKERQMEFDLHIKTTQEVVKEQTEEFINSDEATQEKLTLRDVTKRVTERMKKPRMASVVGEAMVKLGSGPPSESLGPHLKPSTSSDISYSPSSVAKLWHTKACKRKSKLEKGFSSETSEEIEPNVKPSTSSSQQEEGYSPSHITKIWRAKTRKQRTDKTSTSNLVAVPVQKFLELRKKSKPTITSSSTSKTPDGSSKPILKKTQSVSEVRVKNENRLYKRKTETEMLHLQTHHSDSSIRKDCVSPFNDDDVFLIEEPIEVFRSSSQLNIKGDVITEVDEEETEDDMQPTILQNDSPQKRSDERQQGLVTPPTISPAHTSIPDIHIIESSLGGMSEIPLQQQRRSSDPVSPPVSETS